MNLKEYIDTQIIPRYAAFDKAHREDHARAVIQRAMSMGERDAQKWRKEESEALSRKYFILA
jgi:hypothetical protein